MSLSYTRDAGHMSRPLVTLKLDGYSEDEVIFYLLYIYIYIYIIKSKTENKKDDKEPIKGSCGYTLKKKRSSQNIHYYSVAEVMMLII